VVGCDDETVEAPPENDGVKEKEVIIKVDVY
jgi:hypothetical protein